MEKSRRISLAQFHNVIYNAVSTELFLNEFNKHSKAGDRHSMVEMIFDCDHVSKYKIDSHYTPKDHEEAEKLFNNINFIEENSEKKSRQSTINQLTRALFSAEFNTPLFIKILISRAKYCFNAGYYQRCMKDCDYAMKTLANKTEALEDVSEAEKLKNLCGSLKSQSLKLLRKSNKHRSRGGHEIKLPKVDGKPNRKLKNCSDAVELVRDDIRGRHLIATRNIKAGSVLIVDEPFAFSTDEAALCTNCLHCHVSLEGDESSRVPCDNCQSVSFCSEECRSEAWMSYHRYECLIFDNFLDKSKDQRSHVLLAYRTTVAKAVNKMTNALDAEFLCYQDAKSEEAKKSLEIDVKSDFYDSLDYRTVFSLETHCELADAKVNLSRSIKSVYLAKSLAFVLMELEESNRETIGQREVVLLAVAMMRHMQAVNCNAYEIVENLRDCETRTWEPRNIGGAVYSTVSLVNHSCYPNTVRHSYPRGRVVVRSLRFIEKGTEILDCYGPHFVTDSLSSRRQYLLEKYHFICRCDACKSDWKFPFPNEITYRCTSCGNPLDCQSSRCVKCGQKCDAKKLTNQLDKSTKKRIAAVEKMYEGHYTDALPLLLEHSMVVDKVLVAPSLEAIKTQQSIIQCFNSLSNVCGTETRV